MLVKLTGLNRNDWADEKKTTFLFNMKYAKIITQFSTAGDLNVCKMIDCHGRDYYIEDTLERLEFLMNGDNE